MSELRWLVPSAVLVVVPVLLFAALADWTGPTPYLLIAASLAGVALASRLSTGSAIAVAFAIGFLFFMLGFAAAT